MEEFYVHCSFLSRPLSSADGFYIVSPEPQRNDYKTRECPPRKQFLVLWPRKELDKKTGEALLCKSAKLPRTEYMLVSACSIKEVIAYGWSQDERSVLGDLVTVCFLFFYFSSAETCFFLFLLYSIKHQLMALESQPCTNEEGKVVFK